MVEKHQSFRRSPTIEQFFLSPSSVTLLSERAVDGIMEIKNFNTENVSKLKLLSIYDKKNNDNVTY